MLSRVDQTEARDPLVDGLRMSGGTWRRTALLCRYLLVDCGLIRDAVLVYAVLASFSRAALIFSINQAALHPGMQSWPLSLLAASVVATLLFSHLARIRNHEVLKRLQRHMRLHLGRRLLDADIGFLLQHDHGQVYSVMTQEINEVSGLSLTLVECIEAGLLLMICIPYLFYVSWPTGLATLGAVGIGGIGFVVTELPARRMAEKANDAVAAFCDRVDDALGGWMELRLRRSRRNALEEDFARSVEDVRFYSVEAERHFSRGTTATQAALIALLCAIVVGLPLSGAVGTSEMFQILTVVLLTSGPIETIFGALPRVSRALASQKKVAEVVASLQASREHRSSTVTRPPRQHFRRLELRGIAASVGDGGRRAGKYEESFELGPVDLVLESGEIVFISGGNGAGKTTLLALITGLRHPDRGEILLDGVPVGPGEMAELRSLFSAVFSQFHLFRKSYGLDEHERARLGETIVELGLGDRVSMIEESFSTLQLSSGQRRRLALAVALAEQRPIIVLDEFAADQDPQRRAFFYDVLVPRMAANGHLVLAVTHDEHSFDKCDRLIRMESGRIVSDTRIERPAGICRAQGAA